MRPRAYLNLRFTVPERRALFAEGFRRLGFDPVDGLTRAPLKGDVLLTWNRIGPGDEAARIFAERGCTVLVTENASWGNEFAGKQWYTLTRHYHNVAGMFPVGGAERWDSLGVELKPWRTAGETVVLPSRGFGPAAFRMPMNWPGRQPGRIRAHPGRNANAMPLQHDLAQCGRVITWGSGAAVQALMLGVPVESHQPRWIASQDNTDAGRLAMFRTLAWAQATHNEIASGDAIERLLSWQGEG